MNRVINILNLIRLPNVLIIILCQYLLRYGLLRTFLFPDQPEMMSPLLDFTLLVIATVFLTIGGYLINDYFDVRIDAVNRPDRNRVGKDVRIRTIIIAHIVLNSIAILIGFWLAYRLRSFTFGLIFPFVSILLWFYSVRYKRMLFWGNFVVAALSALVIFIVWYFEFLHLRLHPADFAMVVPDLKETAWYFTAYGVFSFLVSLFREIIKDMEDVQGDKTYECRTLPIVIGMNRSNHVVASLVVITILFLAFWQWTFFNRGMILVFWYFLAAVQLPLVYLLYKQYRAGKKEDYHFCSNLCKLIMFAGILSMQLIASII
ncbi:MAG: geranylgeranylglycerol-phosphate geranylgeranyltransferase [Bacteroidetes bacterium]|nr:geranylgeranylglycerol-phosphate geranylgeranyltransferase [Bacteroidota bacterium]